MVLRVGRTSVSASPRRAVGLALGGVRFGVATVSGGARGAGFVAARRVLGRVTTTNKVDTMHLPDPTITTERAYTSPIWYTPR